jgi:flagellar assembly protein FliH
LSSKHLSRPSESLAVEAFTYPPVPAENAAGATHLPGGKHLWAESAEIKKDHDQASVEQREQQRRDQPSVEQREQECRKRGFEEGKAAARAEFEQGLAKLREEIGKTVRDFAAERDSYFHRVEQEVVRLALAIVRKILHRESQMDPLLLTGVLRVALEKVGANTTTRLRANPADIRIWRDYFDQAQENYLAPELVGDPDLEPSRCILETDLGTTEIGLETQLKEIEQGFLDLLAQRPGPR